MFGRAPCSSSIRRPRAGRTVVRRRGEPNPAASAPVERRRLEFARAGTVLARLSDAWSVPDAPLLSGSQREPLWPAAVVGGITHTKGLCVAAVALRSRCRSGSTSNSTNHYRPPLPRASPPKSRRARWPRCPACSRRGWSSREGIYRREFYRTRQFLDFFDVSIELAAHGEFAVELRVDAGPLARGERFHGRWRRRPVGFCCRGCMPC